MRKIIYILLLSVIALPLCAAKDNKQKLKIEKVDFEQIKKETLDPDSKYYFPKLFKMYQSNDTFMTVQDYRYLYYGYTFQEDYNPYRVSEFSGVVDKLYYKSKHNKAECDTIMKYAELSLSDNIFDLRQMQFLIIALKEKRKDARASIWQYRFKRLIAAILSSGAGTEESPWAVINPAHEYNILNFMNHFAVEHKSIGDHIDYLKVGDEKDKNGKVKKANPEGYYFDVSPVIKEYQRKFMNE